MRFHVARTARARHAPCVRGLVVLCVLAACDEPRADRDPSALHIAPVAAPASQAPAAARPARVPAPDAPLPEGAAQRLGGTRLRLPYDVTALAVSGDHRLVAAGSDTTKSIRIWDATTGALRVALDEDWPPDSITAMAFVRDGLVAVTKYNHLRLISTVDGTSRPLPDCATGWVGIVNSFAVAPDGTTVAYGCHASIVLQPTTPGGAAIEIKTEDHDFDRRIVWSPDGAWIAALERFHIEIIDVRARKIVRTLDRDATGLAFTPSGATLVVVGGDVVSLIDLTGRHADTELAACIDVKVPNRAALPPAGQGPVAVSRDGRVLAFVARCRADDRHGEIEVVDLATQKRRTVHGPARRIVDLTFADDAGTELWLAHDRSVRVWSVADDAEVFGPAGHRSAITSLAYAPDGTLASASADGTVRRWNLATGSSTVLAPATDDVTGLAWSTDGAQLDTIDGGGGSLRRWTVRTGLAGPAQPTFMENGAAIARLADDTVFAIGADFAAPSHFRATLVTLPTGERRRGDPDVTSGALAISNDRSLLAYAKPGRVVVVDAARGTTVAAFRRKDAADIDALAFSRDGKQLAVAGHTLDVYRVASPARRAHADVWTRGTPYAVGFLDDGRLIAAGKAGVVQVLDLAHLDEIPNLDVTAHTGDIRALAVAPHAILDGNR